MHYPPLKKIFSGWIMVIGLLASNALFAADYYCDPAGGSPTNSGASGSPWRRLEEVFSAGKTFVSGDTIFLRNGNHGNPVITGGISSGNRTIKAQSGLAPKMRTIRFAGGATHWTVDGVLVSPQEADGSFSNGNLVQFDAGATNNVFQNSQVRSATDSVAGTWVNQNWVDRSGFMAISISGANNQILNNKIRNVRNGIAAQRISTAGAGGTGSLVRGNSINHFWEDAFRCRVSDCTFEYNSAVNGYAVVPPGTEADPPHRDMFQGFRGDGSFQIIANVVLRGNIFISSQGTRYTKIPFSVGKGSNQGIGCFDGPYNNWTIENNVVLVQVRLAMALFGMDNSTIVNNTVVPGSGGSESEIWIVNEKGGSPSDNDIFRNNLAHIYNIGQATNLRQSNNITTSTTYSNYFANYGAGDVHLKSGSPAINAGTATDAPTIDADKAARVAPYDVGAYEFGAVVPVINQATSGSNQRSQTTIALMGTTLRIGTPLTQAMTIELVTLTGKIVGSYNTNQQNIRLDLSTYARGTYCVLMHNTSWTMAKKIFLAE
jgi:hypothetical protein